MGGRAWPSAGSRKIRDRKPSSGSSAIGTEPQARDHSPPSAIGRLWASTHVGRQEDYPLDVNNTWPAGGNIVTESGR